MSSYGSVGFTKGSHLDVDFFMSEFKMGDDPSSAFSKYFDIDWDPVKRELKNRILLPVLGDQYGAVLESGQLKVAYTDGHFSLDYFDRNLPLNPRQVRILLRHDVDSLKARFHEDGDPDLRESPLHGDRATGDERSRPRD